MKSPKAACPKDGLPTGSARQVQQLLQEIGLVLHDHAVSRKDREVERKKKVLEAKIASLKEEFDSAREDLNKTYVEEEMRREFMNKNRTDTMKNRDSKG